MGGRFLARSVAAGIFWLCRASRIFRCSLEPASSHCSSTTTPTCGHFHTRPPMLRCATPRRFFFVANAHASHRSPAPRTLVSQFLPRTLLSERPATSDRLPNWPAHELVDRFSRLLRRNSHQHERLELKRAEGREQRGRPPGVRPPQAPRSSDRARATASYPLA